MLDGKYAYYPAVHDPDTKQTIKAVPSYVDCENEYIK
jgi:hypothetical protein